MYIPKPSNVNEVIAEYLDYYIGLKRPGYAVLLDGEWGAGKTTFVENYMAQKNHEYLYISLHGLQSPSAISERIFVAKHPVLTSKSVAVAGRLIRGMVKFSVSGVLGGSNDGTLDGSATFQPPKDIAKPLRESPTVGNNVLVFDDLERCLLEQKSLWGYIAYLVEYEGAKVLLISNEEKLRKENEHYRRTKEKTVGVTLRVEPDVRAALEVFLKGIPEPGDNSLKSERDLLVEVFERSKCQSLRVLKFALFDIARVVAKLDQKILDNRFAFREFLSGGLAVAIEVHRGNIEIDELYKIDEFLLPDETATKVQKQFSRYRLTRVEPSALWWHRYFKYREIDLVDLNAQLTRHFLTPQPDWYRLAILNRLSEADFLQLLDSTWRKIKYCEYRSVGPILHVVSVRLWAIFHKLLDESPDEVARTAKKCIENAHEGKSRDLTSYENVIYIGHELPKFKEVHKSAEAKIEDLSRKERKAALQMFKECIESEGYESPKLRSITGLHLADIPPKWLVEKVLEKKPSVQDEIVDDLVSELSGNNSDENRLWRQNLLEELGSTHGLRRFFLKRAFSSN